MTLHDQREIFSQLLHQLLKEDYGLTVTWLEFFNGYLDLNVWVKVGDHISNPYIQQKSGHGYVVKLINQNDSKIPELLDARANLEVFLNESGMTAPSPVKSVTGNYSSTVSLNTKVGVIKRLMVVHTYIPGTIMSDLVLTPELLKEVGSIAGKIDMCLQGYHDSKALDSDIVLKLNQTDRIESLLKFAPTDLCHEMAEEIFKEFKTKVVPHINRFQHGLIHHDVGPQNIVMKKDESDGKWKFAAILDFGTTCPSHYVFEVAVILADIFMILSASSLSLNDVKSITKIIVDAYTSFIHLNESELAVLDLCVQFRLVLSSLFGEQHIQMYPENQYITNYICWDLIKMMTKSK